MSNKRPAHDPARDLLTFKILRLIRGQTHAQIGRESGLSPSTIRKLRMAVKDGGTRYPQNYTIDRLLASQGYTRRIVKKKGPTL